jgi:hypothetical protein
MADKHPGFAAVQNKIAGEGYSKKAAGAILANATRNASKSAKKANPRLKRVKGGSTTLSTSSMKGSALANDRLQGLLMPFKSQAQAGYMHSHPEILGKKGLAEWDAATKGKKLPKRAKKVKGGSTELESNSLKAVALTEGPQSNKETKTAFVSRKRKSIGKI